MNFSKKEELMEKTKIEAARNTDRSTIQTMLRENDLPSEDFDEHLNHFLVAKNGENVIVGAVGLEVYNHQAMIRSLVVAQASRNGGIGNELVDGIMAHADELRVRELYLLTTTAEHFFRKYGFKRIERDSLPESIKATKEFTSLCPSTAVCMFKIKT